MLLIAEESVNVCTGLILCKLKYLSRKFGERISKRLFSAASPNDSWLVGARGGSAAFSVGPSAASSNSGAACAIAPSAQKPTRPNIAMNRAAMRNWIETGTRTLPPAGRGAGLHGPVLLPGVRDIRYNKCNFCLFKRAYKLDLFASEG
jgi:hypothetical protein